MTPLVETLPRYASSVGTARRLVNDHTVAFASRQRANAALMTSELVTNALVHGTGTISLRIDVEFGALRVEISDQGDAAVAPSPTPGPHGGWGLRLVDQLADEWGVLEGSRVWFRIGRLRAQH